MTIHLYSLTLAAKFPRLKKKNTKERKICFLWDIFVDVFPYLLIIFVTFSLFLGSVVRHFIPQRREVWNQYVTHSIIA